MNLKKHFTVWMYLVPLAISALFITLYYVSENTVSHDEKIIIGLFVSAPAFIFSILQHVRTQQIQRAGHIRDFLSEFRRNDQIYKAYYDLVYSYRNELYDRVTEIFKTKRSSFDSMPRPIFECFEELQEGREVGARLFHFEIFHFSDEERRLDGLLDYFNSLGFYYYEGLIDMKDIVSTLGDYIAVLADRKVITEYLEYCDAEWKYDNPTVGACTPYPHLRYLIEAYKHYNLKEHNKKQIAKLKRELDALKGRK